MAEKTIDEVLREAVQDVLTGNPNGEVVHEEPCPHPGCTGRIQERLAARFLLGGEPAQIVSRTCTAAGDAHVRYYEQIREARRRATLH